MSRLKELRKYVYKVLFKMDDQDELAAAITHLNGVALAATILAKKRGFDPKTYMEKKKIEAILKEFSCKDYTDLMYRLAVRTVNPTAVCEKLTNQKRGVNDSEALTELLSREPSKKPVMTRTGIVVPGIESIKLSLAQCCLPVYGDKIVGYISKGEGVKVHRQECVNVAGQQARLIDCYWEEEERERLYESDLVIISEDRNFLLTDIVNYVSQARAPMLKVSAKLLSTGAEKTVTTEVVPGALWYAAV